MFQGSFKRRHSRGSASWLMPPRLSTVGFSQISLRLVNYRMVLHFWAPCAKQSLKTGLVPTQPPSHQKQKNIYCVPTYSDKLAHIQVVIKQPIFRCTNVHPWRYAHQLFRRTVFRWRHESQYAHNSMYRQILVKTLLKFQVNYFSFW